MQLIDLAGATPGVVVSILVGYAVATLVAPRWAWWERLAAAPGLAAGAVGAIGLLLHDLHVPFRALDMVPLLLVVIAAAVLRRRRAGGAPVAAHGAVVAVVVALVVGAASAATLAHAFRDQPLPVETDSAIHAAVAVGIVRQHDILPRIAEPYDGTQWVRPRNGFEAEAALVAETGGPAAERALLPLAMAAVLLLPLGLVALVLAVGGTPWMAALAAPASLLIPFPAFALSLGEFPYVADATLVAPMIIALVRLARGAEVREAAVLVAACSLAIWVVHGLELFTVVLLGAAPVLAAALLAGRRALARLVAGGAAAGLGVLLGEALIRLPAVPTGVTPRVSGPAAPEDVAYFAAVSAKRLVDAYYTARSFLAAPTLLIVLALIGVGIALRTRRMRWAVVSEALVLLAYADIETGARLHRLWVKVYPWSADDRILSIQYWALPVVIGTGIALVAVELSRSTGDGRGGRWALLVSAAVALAMAVPGLGHASDYYRGFIDQKGVVTSADLAAMADMAGRLQPGAAVLFDGSDAGQWIDTLTPQALYLPRTYFKSHGPDPRVVALARACSTPPDVTQFGGIDAVYVGARHVLGAADTWSVACLRGVPWLQQVVDRASPDGEAAVFRVVGPGGT